MDIESDQATYDCSTCGKLTQANIKTRLYTIPDYIIFHLKRFHEPKEGVYKKNRRPIQYPMRLEMDQFCAKAWSSLGTYELVGAILHKGRTLGRGHYVAFTKRQEDKWYFCNDSDVKIVNDEDFVL